LSAGLAALAGIADAPSVGGSAQNALQRGAGILPAALHYSRLCESGASRDSESQSEEPGRGMKLE
jgi:hypothetical protein